MNDDVLVRVENVSKRFCRSLKRSLWYGLQDLGSEIGGRRHGGGSGLPQSSADVQLRPDEFWAVKDVSFELRRGECLGLIGRNGAGKTTLLRMLNGLIKPDTGRIETSGSVGALIALGSGFNPVLTGRENVYIGGGILGLTSAEINKKLDEIIDFAEIEEFIDAPVQSYSSGMQARLGFAVASSLNQDILLIDEILSVGDTAFREKCYARLASLRKNGCGFVLVAHSELAIANSTDTCCLLEKGNRVFYGETQRALAKYKALISRPNHLQASESTGLNWKRLESQPTTDFPFIESIIANPAIYGKQFEMTIQINKMTHAMGLEWKDWSLEIAFSAQSNFAPAFSISRKLEASSSGESPSISFTSFRSPSLPLPPGRYNLKAWIRNTETKLICSIIENINLTVELADLSSEELKNSFAAISSHSIA